jgi:murein L,D-transpeptidase YafK
MRKIVYLLIPMAVILTAVFVYGRSVWHPLYVKISGGKTVNEVVGQIREQNEIRHDFESWQSLHLLCFKEERNIEVWATEADGRKRKIKNFPFTGFSGDLGPKLREGDGQIPEGIYRIEYLNPNSSYHLSMKVSYPNAFDREKGRQDGRDQLGFDIFIHGKSSTIGCIPVGDPGIEELFLMVSEVGVSNVDVIISPYDMRAGKRVLEIPEIEWEGKLYDQIERALTNF